MGYSKIMLEDTFMSAHRTDAQYVAVRIRVEGSSADEVIINPKENILTKLDYYRQAYDDQLCLKANRKIKIVSAAYGNSFEEIQRVI